MRRPDSDAVVAPWAKSDGTNAAGSGARLGPSGTTLRFVPNTSFEIGIVLRNTSPQTVTLVDVRTLDPAHSLIRQQGTRLIAWIPPPCSGRHSCLAIGFLRGSFGSAKPQPVSVRPAGQAAVQLDVEVGGCAALPFAAPGAAQQIDLAYRVGSGALEPQAISLGAHGSS